MNFPIRTDLIILSADKPKFGYHELFIINSRGKMEKNSFKLKLGWTVKETIGYAVINTKALSKLNKTTIIE